MRRIDMKTIEVRGLSEIRIQPNSMELSFQLIVEDELYQTARETLRKDRLDLIRIFNEFELGSSKLKTKKTDVIVVTDQNDGKKFKLTQDFVYRDRINIEQLSALLDELNLDNNFQFNLRYYHDNLNPYIEKSLLLAFRDAKRKAHILALEAEMSLEDVLSIKEDDIRPQFARTMSAVDSVEDLKFEKSLTITWSMK